MRSVVRALVAIAMLVLAASCSGGADGGDRTSTALYPDRAARIAVNGGAAELLFPEGAVMEQVNVVVTSLGASQVPAVPAEVGVHEVLFGFRVDGISQTTRPVRISFVLPGEADDAQVIHQHADQWSMMPSHVDDEGRLVVETSTFSTFALVLGTMRTETTLYQAPGFDPHLYAVHANNEGTVFERVGVVKDADRFRGFCYGMAETAALYYLAGRESPGARQPQEAAGTDVNNTIHSRELAELVRNLQHQSWVTGWVWQEIVRLANPLDFGTYAPLSRAEDLYIKLAGGRPIMMIVSNLDLSVERGFHHAMLVYRAYKRYNATTDVLEYEFWLYDPNGYQYDGDAHGHHESRVTVTVTNYNSGRFTPWTRSQSVAYDLAYVPPDLKVFFGTYLTTFNASLPWGNPSVSGVSSQVTGSDVRLSASFTHPSPGGSFARAVWYVESDGGGYLDVSDKVAVSGSTSAFTFAGLPPGNYMARVVVEDSQGNWSRASQTRFSVGSELIDPTSWFGPWINLDPDTGAWRYMIVARSGHSAVIQPYGKCTPWECVVAPFELEDSAWHVNDHGVYEARTTWDHGFAVEDVTLRLQQPSLFEFSSYTVYVDGSGREPRHLALTFGLDTSSLATSPLSGSFSGETWGPDVDPRLDVVPMSVSLTESGSSVHGTVTADSGYFTACYGSPATLSGTRDGYVVYGEISGAAGRSSLVVHLIDGLYLVYEGDDYQGSCDGVGVGSRLGLALGRLWR